MVESRDEPSTHFVETPRNALGPILREKVLLEGRTFWIDRPEESRQLLDNPVIRTAFQADEYLPYWTDLWPAARMLAKAILREPWPNGLTALEVGCGLGLPGIAALARGLRVVFSDCDCTALHFAAANARLNGFQDFETLPLDWRKPPPELRVPIVLCSDLTYELRNINPVVKLIKQVLLPQGVCLLTDQDRLPAYNLQEALQGEGLTWTTKVMHAGQPVGGRYRGTLYRIGHAR